MIDWVVNILYLNDTIELVGRKQFGDNIAVVKKCIPRQYAVDIDYIINCFKQDLYSFEKKQYLEILKN